MQGDEDEDDLNTDTVPLPQFISGAAHHRGQGSFVGERMKIKDSSSASQPMLLDAERERERAPTHVLQTCAFYAAHCKGPRQGRWLRHCSRRSPPNYGLAGMAWSRCQLAYGSTEETQMFWIYMAQLLKAGSRFNSNAASTDERRSSSST